MADVLLRCEVCRGLLDEEDLFCANCGTEAPHRSEVSGSQAHVMRHSFHCDGCGASMSYDASAQNLRCPFCGSERLTATKEAKSLAPNWVLPFAISHADASNILKKWLQGSFWRPRDLATTAVVTKMAAVYVPYWIFRAKTFTYWNSDTNQVPRGARGDWRPLHGEHRSEYQGVLIGASGTLTPQETSQLCPFELSNAVPPEKVDLENSVYEPFTVQRKYARPLARSVIEQLERNACSGYVPGTARNLKVNVRLEELTSEPILLPVWIVAYHYRKKIFRFLINGQSGRSTGQAPFDWSKLVKIVGIVLAVILVIAAIAAIVNR